MLAAEAEYSYLSAPARSTFLREEREVLFAVEIEINSGQKSPKFLEFPKDLRFGVHIYDEISEDLTLISCIDTLQILRTTR